MRADLAKRYGEERLPRYTSYPTAPHFTPAISRQTYARWLEELPADKSASLYLHVPFCRAMCWYCGCNTTVASRDGPVVTYLAALHAEIEHVATRIPQRLTAQHIHIGGGTPTIMTPPQFDELCAVLHAYAEIRPDAEFAIEIDPRALSPDMARALGANGVTRASIGVQSFDDTVQRAINRVQDFIETARAVDRLRGSGIHAFNFDLVYGLPHQTTASCIDTVRQCLSLRPDRFSVFGYAHVPGFKKHQRKIDATALPGSTERHEQAEAIAVTLRDAGYEQIGLDHFALPDDAMARAAATGTLHRNFQGYTTDASDTLIGFGASAIGQLPQGYVQNDPALGSYRESIRDGRLATVRGYALHNDDRLRADIIERLMCDFEADLGAICARHDKSAAALLQSASRLTALVEDGVVTLDGTHLRLADDAHFLVRSVASCFDTHMDAQAKLHSRAV